MAETTRAGAVRQEFYDLAVSLLSDEDVQVVLGVPGTAQWDDIVSIEDTSMEQDVATLGPSRQREETIRQTVIISVYRAGGEDQEKVVTDRAYEILGTIENYLRKTDPTLGGIVLWCFLTSVEFASTDANTATGGRIAGIAAVFTARARIRTS